MQPELISVLGMIISKLTVGLLGLNSAFLPFCPLQILNYFGRIFEILFDNMFWTGFLCMLCIGLLGLLTWVEHSLRSTRKIQSEGVRCEKKQKL